MCVNLLENKTFFKLVCGAGNRDLESVKKQVFVYAKAGCKVFDLSADFDVLNAAKDGANLAGARDIHFCVSVGIKGDPHISKAGVNYGVNVVNGGNDSDCIKCGNCVRSCPNSAISPPNVIDDKKCIGCGICVKKCPTGAIKMYEKDADVKNILPEMVKKGVEILELHIMGHDKKDLDYKWSVINECSPKLASICVDREIFGNKEILERISDMIKDRKPYSTIIQADGIPMSGGADDYKTTLQAVAMAEIIQNANFPVYLTLSGGTNSKTMELCHKCNIHPNGIAIGSWARKIVKPYLDLPDFWENVEAQNKAAELAMGLIDKNIYGI
jgi:ferredoxin